jgi:hypothetical protein
LFKPNFRLTPVTASALMMIEGCRQAIEALPIDAAVLQQLRETAALATTRYSTFIEGNRPTLPEVRAARDGRKFPGRERDEIEVRNHFRALAWMESLVLRDLISLGWHTLTSAARNHQVLGQVCPHD